MNSADRRTRLDVAGGPGRGRRRAARGNGLDQLAAHSEFTPAVRRLGCPRGIGTLTGLALAVEIGDWHRFTGNAIGSFVRLAPTEYSSGGTKSQGSITKTGNGHARRLLVEAAWHHRSRYSIGATLRARWDLAPAAARARRDAGNRRLHQRWIKFGRRTRSTTADVAIAHELAGWFWSPAIMDD